MKYLTRLCSMLGDLVETLKWALGQRRKEKHHAPWWVHYQCPTSLEGDNMVAMSEDNRTVQMAIIDPGTTAPNGEYTFELQPRYNPGRTVKFALIPSDAEKLCRALKAYLDDQHKVFLAAQSRNNPQPK